MTFERDLAWQHMDLVLRSSVAYQFAHYALGLNYEMLPADVLHQAKRCLLDTLGCAIGGYEAPGYPICEDVVKELGGSEEATVIGSGLRTTAFNATLVNSFMVRFLDYNDIGGGQHNSDSIPGILAVSEREKSGGRDLLTAVVISYELGARYSASLADWGNRGWIKDSRAGLTMPAVMGRLMGLNADQIANAIGSCACGNPVLRILDTPGEEQVMRKNLRFGWISCAAIIHCMLAKRGFTGPVRIVEGEKGINKIMYNGDMDFERMTDFRDWYIRDVRFKFHSANGGLQALSAATLAIVRANDLKPEEIATVNVKMHHGGLHRRTTSLKYPRNAEQADHSPSFVAAIAIKDRIVSPDQFRMEKFTDPGVLELMEKVTVEDDLSLPAKSPKDFGVRAARVEIITTDGRRLQHDNLAPHGLGDDPLTDEELETKFTGMAARYMGEQQIRQVFDTVWNVEKLDDINKLMKLMVFESRKPK
jgi:2-methylcitrate dehydratase